jgi:cysteine desulfurase / selenocysteine lyase
MQIYLDNSATSWPKPDSVKKAVVDFFEKHSGSPGRSGHSMSLRSARILFETRELLADFFEAPLSERVIFAQNATHAINIAIHGILKQGDHVITGSMEHNSVMRPLRQLEEKGVISITNAPIDSTGNCSEKALEACFQSNTKMCIINHVSNVNGALMPIESISSLCKKHNVLFMLDASQSAGMTEISMKSMNTHILAFTGHKKLYGPIGSGGLCFAENVNIEPWMTGGTGSRSEEELHPDFYPDKLEAGTPNTPAIAGLKAGIEHLLHLGKNNVFQEMESLTKHFVKQIQEIDELKVYTNNNMAVISVTSPLFTPDHLSFVLESEYGILTRPGLHCSPMAHKSLGTFPHGTVRFSPGLFNTLKDMDFTAQAIKSIINKHKKQ